MEQKGTHARVNPRRESHFDSLRFEGGSPTQSGVNGVVGLDPLRPEPSVTTT